MAHIAQLADFDVSGMTDAVDTRLGAPGMQSLLCGQAV
jgi:hypothetical protein